MNCCDDYGNCQQKGDCPARTQKAMQPYPNTIPPEAGNVWFAEPEPPEPMTTCEAFARLAVLSASATTVIFMLINIAELLFPNLFN